MVVGITWWEHKRENETTQLDRTLESEEGLSALLQEQFLMRSKYSWKLRYCPLRTAPAGTWSLPTRPTSCTFLHLPYHHAGGQVSNTRDSGHIQVTVQVLLQLHEMWTQGRVGAAEEVERGERRLGRGLLLLL